MNNYIYIYIIFRTGVLLPTDLGKIASVYYLQYETAGLFNENITDSMEMSELLQILAHSSVHNIYSSYI